jgi:hypothetical protein
MLRIRPLAAALAAALPALACAGESLTVYSSAAPGTLDASAVAEASLDALGHGPTVVPGATNQLARFVLGRVLSRRAAIGIMARSTKELT